MDPVAKIATEIENWPKKKIKQSPKQSKNQTNKLKKTTKMPPSKNNQKKETQPQNAYSFNLAMIFFQRLLCLLYRHSKNVFIPVNVQWDTKTVIQCAGRYCEKHSNHSCFYSVWSKEVLLRVGTDLSKFAREKWQI